MARPPDVPQPETELEEFFDLSIDPLSIIGFDGEFKRVNASFVRLLGYTKPELFSRSALDILHPDDVEPAREALAQLAEGHDLAAFEARVICANGDVRWLEWSARSLPERGVLYSVGRDTTERRRAAAELRAAQRLLEASRDELRVLAEEQAALRRVATLVARTASQAEVFSAIAEELGRLMGVDHVRMWRFEEEDTATTVASAGAFGSAMPVGLRERLHDDSLAGRVHRSGRSQRIDDYARTGGRIAERALEIGVGAAVATPIVVEGRLWGAMVAASRQPGRLPAGTEARMGQFTELMATAIANAESRGRANRLALEQAALRRVATLVAKEAPLEEVFAKVAEGVADVLGAVECGLLRDEGDGTARIVAISDASAAQIGTRLSLAEESVTALVLREGRAARIDDYSAAVGDVAHGAQERGIRSSVGCPIVVGERTWGVMAVATRAPEPLPADAEARIAQFSELVATAIANFEARAEVERLADEQAALRRVATLVAEEQSPAEVFAKVAEEAANVLEKVECALLRDSGDDSATVVAAQGADMSARFPVGTQLPTEGVAVLASALREGWPQRIEYRSTGGATAEAARDLGISSAVASPIVAREGIWGAIVAARFDGESCPPNTETRLAQFADLVATAIANAVARAQVKRLADEQAALRRVAMLAAAGASPTTVLDAVAAEVQALLDADQVALSRFEPGDEILVLAHRGVDVQRTPVGSRLSIAGENAPATVRRTGRPARIESYESAEGAIAEIGRDTGLRSSVSAPISVEDRLWGLITASWKTDEPPPPETEERMVKFAELLDTAIAKVQARSEVERLAEQQGALRRVATMVARERPAEEVFAKVAEEVALLLGVEVATVRHFEPDGRGTIVGRWGELGDAYRVGSRMRQEGESVTTLVYRTGRSARFDDYLAARAIPADARALGLRGAVASPIVVNGRLWGAIAAGTSRPEPMPADAESRIAEFTELVATAISNVQARSDLAASRARIVAAADQERRRVVRDLHDGAQQRLVHTIVTLKLAQRALRQDDEKSEALLGEALQHAEQGNAELRELAHGILPAVLTRGGLRAGVDALVARLDLPVRVEVSSERLPAELEASGYFIVAEALTNVMKHAYAARAEVTVSVEDGVLQVEVRDDGVGGADPNGQGLIGMADRVSALGGQLRVDSPADGGTLVSATLPLSTDGAGPSSDQR